MRQDQIEPMQRAMGAMLRQFHETFTRQFGELEVETPLTRDAFGAMVRDARIAKGLTQVELGRGSRGFVQDIESGKKWPGMLSLAQLRRVLGIDVNAALDRMPLEDDET